MNAPYKPEMQRTRTFTVWRTCDETPGNEAHPLRITADTLAEAVQEAAQSCHHKDTLVVLEVDHVTRTQTQHAYRIVRKAAKWIRDPVTGLEQRINPLEASPLFSMAVKSFAPVEPWRWSPGADVVGVDRTLIDAPA